MREEDTRRKLSRRKCQEDWKILVNYVREEGQVFTKRTLKGRTARIPAMMHGSIEDLLEIVHDREFQQTLGVKGNGNRGLLIDVTHENK